MKQIERYIFLRVFTLSIGTLVTTTVIALTTQVLIRVNLLSSTGQSLLTFLELAGLLIPAMVVIVMPFALMIGASQTLGTMNSDSELAVIEASGGSRMLTARPILLLALLMALTTLVTSVVVEPWSNRKIRDLLNSASADLFSVAVQSGTFHEIEEGLHVQVGEKLPGGKLGGIFLSDRRDDVSDVLYYAKYGAFVEDDGKDILIMSDGELHRKSNEDGKISIIRFATYALDLSLIGGRASKGSSYYAKERTTRFLLSPDPNDGSYKYKPSQFREELNKRFSEWMYPLLFGLITVYFLGKAHTNRNEQVWSVVTAASIAFATRGFSFYAVDQSGSSEVFAILVFAVPLASMALFSLLILTNWSFRPPKRLVEQVARLGADRDPPADTPGTWNSGLSGSARGGTQ